MNEQPYVLYVADAYCGWCFGFGPRMKEFAAANRSRIDIRVISGGLFLGERALPIRNYPHIPKANAKIAEETGVKFGASYSALLKDGSFIIDSAAAAAGLISLRSQDEKRGIEFFGRMQEAFYVDGKSLSDFSTYTRIAQDAAIDPAQTQRMLTSGEAATKAHEDFATARKFGADSYPTLLLVKGRRAHPLTTFTTLDVMNRELEVGLRDL